MAGPALAFSVSLQSGAEIRWATPQIEYELHEAGSDDLQDGSDLAAIRRAVQSWNQIACSEAQFVETGTTIELDTIATTGELDGLNRFVFIEDESWPYGSLVYGAATPIFDADGVILEADISFNGYSASWSTSEEADKGDVESVAVHELGHVLGLQHVLGGHNLGAPPTMSALMDAEFRGRDLEHDDALGACYLYPVDEYPCQTSCDCPRVLERNLLGQERYIGQVQCNQGACSELGNVVLGVVQLGGACAFDDECAENLFCAPTAYGAYCSSPCGLESPCAIGFDCWYWDAEEENGGACMLHDLPEIGGSNIGACLASPTEDGTCWCDSTDSCTADCPCDADCQSGCACSMNESALAPVWLLGWLLLWRRFHQRFPRFHSSDRCA